MSNWLVAIVGGAIATVIGGFVLFYVLPSTQTPGLSTRSIELEGGVRHLKCRMSSGPMEGQIYSLSVDTARKKVWTREDGDFLRILRFDEQSISISTVFPRAGLPRHDYVELSVNRITLNVEAHLYMKQSSEEHAQCRSRSGFQEGDIDFCGTKLVGRPSTGRCEGVARTL
jgi:hypothetical protein